MAQRDRFFAKLKEKQYQSLVVQKEIETLMPSFVEEVAKKSEELQNKNSESKRLHDQHLASLAAAETLKSRILEDRKARSQEAALKQRQEDILKCIKAQEEKTARWRERNTPKPSENPLLELQAKISRIFNRPEILRLSTAARSLAAKEPLEFLETAPASYFRDLERKVLVSS